MKQGRFADPVSMREIMNGDKQMRENARKYLAANF